MGLKVSRPLIEPIELDAFIASAMVEFMSELQMSRLALIRATSDSIRSLAIHLVDDCNRIILDMQRIATRRNLTLPSSLDEEHEKLLESLRETISAEFDSVYIELTALRHRRAIRLFKRGQTIKIPEISALASRALAMTEARVKLSRQLSGNIDSLLDERFPQAGTSVPSSRSGAES